MTLAHPLASADSLAMDHAPPAHPHPTHLRDGLLSLSQRWQLTLNLLWGRTRSALTARRASPATRSALGNPVLWRSLQPPTSALATQAWAHASARQPAWLNNHCLRTYAWGQAVGLIAGLSADTELLFVATALHDLGLTAAASAPEGHCFAMRGAQHARQLLAPLASAERTEAVAYAIERHLDFRVDLQAGVEAHLLQAGAMMDVLGRGLSRVPEGVRGQVLGAHPRLHMKRELCLCMQQQAHTAPHSRVGLYVRRFGFVDLIRHAPFEE